MTLMFIFLTIGFYLILKTITNAGKKKQNPYIAEHRKKMNDDIQYNEYLEFCKKNGELPMEKEGFHELRRKEREMSRKLNKAMK